MQGAVEGTPIQAFQNVEPLDKVALTKSVKVDTPDTAPEDAGEGPTTIGTTPTVPDATPQPSVPVKPVATAPPQNLPPPASTPQN